MLRVHVQVSEILPHGFFILTRRTGAIDGSELLDVTATVGLLDPVFAFPMVASCLAGSLARVASRPSGAGDFILKVFENARSSFNLAAGSRFSCDLLFSAILCLSVSENWRNWCKSASFSELSACRWEVAPDLSFADFAVLAVLNPPGKASLWGNSGIMRGVADFFSDSYAVRFNLSDMGFLY